MSKYLSIITPWSTLKYLDIFWVDGGMVMRDKTCCFTGHRTIPLSEMNLVTQKTEEFIKSLILNGVKYFGVGGALGYDTLAAEILFRLKSTCFGHIKIILVYPFKGYTKRWTPEQYKQYLWLLPKYDKIVCASQHPSREAYFKRNRHLVDNSGYCIAYCTKAVGGTAYTLKYAQSKGGAIFNTSDFDIRFAQ